MVEKVEVSDLKVTKKYKPDPNEHRHEKGPKVMCPICEDIFRMDKIGGIRCKCGYTGQPVKPVKATK